MDTFAIKLIAIITMVIDHIGIFYFPQDLLFRGIGRLSFPLFAWLIANGAKHTKNIDAYMKRLLIFGVISQLPFLLAKKIAEPNYFGLNIMFTLFLGLLAIKIFRADLRKAARYFLIFLCALAASFIKAEYGALGVLSILLFYVFFGNVKKTILSQAVIYTLIWPIQYFFTNRNLDIMAILQIFALFSLVLVFQYNSKQGIKAKYLFYLFYPIQYLVFYFLKVFWR